MPGHDDESFHASIADDDQVRRFNQNSINVRNWLENCNKAKRDMRDLKGEVQGIRDAEIVAELQEWREMAIRVFDIN